MINEATEKRKRFNLDERQEENFSTKIKTFTTKRYFNFSRTHLPPSLSMLLSPSLSLPISLSYSLSLNLSPSLSFLLVIATPLNLTSGSITDFNRLEKLKPLVDGRQFNLSQVASRV